MTIHEARQKLLINLYEIYEQREAGNIADLVMEKITGWKKIDRIINKHLKMLPNQIEELEKYSIELLEHKPVQYVIKEAWFMGRKFYVNEHVLIPRPETEELVHWVVSDYELMINEMQRTAAENGQLTILDIGTGSGCIPICLKLEVQKANLYSCDISEDALKVARWNATNNEAEVSFLHVDILNEQQWSALPECDIIVSNPPYIPLSEKQMMQPNVVLHEPHMALFVDNDDPLIFYRKIAELGKLKLTKAGKIYVETHEVLAQNVMELFRQQGYALVIMKQDMQGKERMVKCQFAD
jgi:release factor glutamine methyltransferase